MEAHVLVDVQALSNTIWGFSKLEVVHEKLLDAVAAMALKKLPQFNGQNIANTVSSYQTELSNPLHKT